jgi:hypothetical protein
LTRHGFLRARFFEDVERGDPAFRDALDLGRPARRDVADLDPVIHHGAIELECARGIGLGAENLDEALGAVHDFLKDAKD